MSTSQSRSVSHLEVAFLELAALAVDEKVDVQAAVLTLDEGGVLGDPEAVDVELGVFVDVEVENQRRDGAMIGISNADNSPLVMIRVGDLGRRVDRVRLLEILTVATPLFERVLVAAADELDEPEIARIEPIVVAVFRFFASDFFRLFDISVCL